MATFSKPNFQIKFPGDVDAHDQFMHFTISKKYKFRREQIDEKEKLATITLPLPTALNTSYAATYSNQPLMAMGDQAGRNAPGTMAALEGIASAVASGNLTGGGGPRGGSGAVDKLSNLVNGLTGGDGKSKVIELAKYYLPEGATALGAAVGSATGGLGAGIAGTLVNQIVKGTLTGLGRARNPYLAATFDGVQFKNHSFQFQLTPRNAQESNSIRSIISAFRNAMLPGKGTVQHYYDYPQQVDIAFRHDEYLFDIKTSVLTQFDVNYHGKGAYYHDINGKKAPVEVGINMTFLESTVRLSDDEKFSNNTGF
jgi:hypothetical protein